MLDHERRRRERRLGEPLYRFQVEAPNPTGPLSPADLAKVAAELPKLAPGVLPDALDRELQWWAMYWPGMPPPTHEPPTKRKDRTIDAGRLRRVAKAASDLVSALRDADRSPASQALLEAIGPGSGSGLVPDRTADLEELRDLVAAADRLAVVAKKAAKPPRGRRGRPPNERLHAAIMALAWIFKEATGRKPTISNHPIMSTRGGRFHAFVHAVTRAAWGNVPGNGALIGVVKEFARGSRPKT